MNALIVTYWPYLKYLIKHKYFVYQSCRLLGLGLYQSLTHDWTKFKASEFFPYAKFFYSKIKNSDAFSKDFDVAWNYHQKHNRHHWQYWVLIKDDGTLKPLEMPEHYMKEMVADWRGAGLSINGSNDVKAWYENNKTKMILHPDTRVQVETLLKSL